MCSSQHQTLDEHKVCPKILQYGWHLQYEMLDVVGEVDLYVQVDIIHKVRLLMMVTVTYNCNGDGYRVAYKRINNNNY